MTNPVSTQTWSTYLDFEEVWQYLEMDSPPAGAQQSKLQRMIDAACTEAQNRSNRPLAPTQFKERHDGWSGEYIMLHRSPFLQLISCREWMSTGGWRTLPEASAGNNGFDGVTIDYGTSRIMRSFAGGWPRPFFPGARNVEVTYLAGFNPVPPDIWRATMDLTAIYWRNSQEMTRWFKTGQSYGGQAPDMSYPGMPGPIAAVFDHYRLPSIG